MPLISWLVLLSPTAAAQAFTPPPDALWALGPGGWGLHTSGDFDGDGVGDLAWTLEQQALIIAFGQPAGVPLAPIPVPLGGETPINPLAAADLDGDGADDLFSRVLSGPVIRGWPGAAGGPTGPAWTLVDSARARGVGDTNGDGSRDLALGTAIWLSSPTGPTAGPVLPNAEEESHLFDVGDVNGDGFDDVAGPDPARDPSGGFYDIYAGPLRLYLGGPTGPATTPLWSHDVTGTTGWTLTMADVDADGVRELIAACLTLQGESATGSIVVLDDLANPAGPTELTVTPVDFDLGQGFELATLGDRDGDGAEEVVVGMMGRIRAAPWTAGGGLDLAAAGADEWVSTSGDTLMSLVAADVDGDGRTDLSARWYDETTNDQVVTVWLAVPPSTGTTDTGTPSSTGTGDTGLADTGADTGPPLPGTDTGTSDTGETPSKGCGCAQGPGVGAGAFGLLLVALARRRGSS